MAPKKRGDRSLRAGQTASLKHAQRTRFDSGDGVSQVEAGTVRQSRRASEERLGVRNLREKYSLSIATRSKAAIRRKLIKWRCEDVCRTSDRAFGKPPQTVDVNGQIQTS